MLNYKGEVLGPWKVLVMDAAGQRIMAPLMTVNELRGEGVTLYLQLQQSGGSERQKIPSASAVYFIDGSNKDSIDRVCADIRDGLYSSIQLNMTSSIPRSNLEQLAMLDSSESIISIFDQYMDYICIEENLFITPPFGPTVCILFRDFKCNNFFV
jgi:hypothetical protein